MNEIWKPIANYENYYVSSLGNVKSTKNFHGQPERILKPGKSNKGYLLVALSKNGKEKVFNIHRLVALAFVPNPHNYEQVNHINENKTDNRAENLEWCTAKINVNHGTRTARQIQKCSKKVVCIETNIVYPSTADAARKLGLNQGNISNCCSGRNKTCGGYHWKYYA